MLSYLNVIICVMTWPGDTRPCQSVIDAAQQATLLVHEATFENGMEVDAIAKNHSTTGDAVGVAAAAGVYRVVLTHFSSRYDNSQVVLSCAQLLFPVCCC